MRSSFWTKTSALTPGWRLLQRRWPVLLIGLVTLAVGLGGFWYGVERGVQAKEQAARERLAQRVVSQANTYTVQLEHLSEQLNQVARRISRQWQSGPDSVDLRRDAREELLPPLPGFSVFILDAAGQVAQASFPPVLRDGSQLDFFTAHRDQCCLEWLVTAPTYGPIVGHEVVRFTRRLTRADGAFAGVLVLEAPPDFLKSFQDDAVLGPHDFVSVRLTTGPLVTMKQANGQAPVGIFTRDPVFSLAQGVGYYDGTYFKDGRSRYVAWHKHPTMPIVAIAAAAEAEALAGFTQVAAETRAMALVTSLAILAVALGGMFFYGKWTLRRLNEEDMRHTYRVATDAANEGFYMLSVLPATDGATPELCIEDCNAHAAELLGQTREAVLGHSLARVVPAAMREELVGFCALALQFGMVEDELRVPAESGLSVAWLYRRAVHARQGLALTLRDISAPKHHEAELVRIANHDALTGLPNRHWLVQYLPTAIDRARHGHGQLAVLFIDLDNFKLVNDTLGHDAGDALLSQAAERIQQAVRSTDSVVRWGGDEFTVILEHAEHRDVIVQVAGKIVAALDSPFALAGTAANQIGASVGVAIYPMHGATAELLLKHADVAMYAAKTAGKGRLTLYQPQMSSALFERLDRERAMQEALEQQQFVVYYQPRVGAASGQLASLEALVRWRHPVRGVVLPAEFIDLAEETGAIVQLGNQVIRQVIEQLGQWQRDGLPLVPVSVNVSPAQLKAGSVVQHLQRLLEAQQVAPQWVEVEVTETAIVERSPVVTAELEGMRRLGIRLMIDDFGTGHSSLAQLHRLKVDTLKVDKSFTELLARGADGEPPYEAIISMASAMHMRVVAEGVETEAQRYMLQSLGCNEIQGYVAARAVAPEQVPPMLTQPQLLASCGEASRTSLAVDNRPT